MQCACWRGAQGRTCGKKWWMFLKAIWALSLSFSSSFALSTLHVGFSIHPHQALGFFFYNTLYASLSHFFPRLHNPSGTIYLLRPCYVCVCVCVWQIPRWLQAGIPLVSVHPLWLLRRPGAQVHALPADANKRVQDEPGGAHCAGCQQSVARAGVQRLVISQHVQDSVGDVQLLLRP